MTILCCVVPLVHLCAIYHCAQKVVRCNLIRDFDAMLTAKGNGLQNENEP